MMSVTSSSDLLLLLDQRGIVDRLVVDLDVVVAGDGVGVGDLLARRLGVGLLERNEFGVLRLRHQGLVLHSAQRRAQHAPGGARVVTAASSITVSHFGQVIGVLLRS